MLRSINYPYVIEAVLFAIWLVLMIFSQFFAWKLRKTLIKFDFFGFFPSFHLFSPKPFLGRYIIRYRVYDQLTPSIVIHTGKTSYITKTDFFHANKKVIKCVNNLCRDLPKKRNVNSLRLLTNYVRNDLKQKPFTGRFRYIILKKNGSDVKRIFRSKKYDL